MTRNKLKQGKQRSLIVDFNIADHIILHLVVVVPLIEHKPIIPDPPKIPPVALFHRIGELFWKTLPFSS